MKENIKSNKTTATDRLLQLIEMRGLSKGKIAQIAGVSPQAVTGWFNRGEISKVAAKKIAAETGVSIDWLLDGGPELHELNAHRAKRLAAWFSDKKFPSDEEEFFKQLISGEVPFADKAARRIEVDYELPFNYLDSGFDSTSPGKLSDEDIELLYYFHRLTPESKKEIKDAVKKKAEFYDQMFEELKKIRGL